MLGVPSVWTPSKGGSKQAGSAPSSPGESRRSTSKDMTFDEMAALSKSAPTTPGTQRRNKLKRSQSSKGSAFIVEHKSGRMVSVAARKTILSGESSDNDDDQDRKKVQLPGAEVTPIEAQELEAALNKATAKLVTRRESTEDGRAMQSPDIVLTPPDLASLAKKPVPKPRSRSPSPMPRSRSSSPKPKDESNVTQKPPKRNMSSDMGSKIAGLQHALLSSPVHQSRLSSDKPKPGPIQVPSAVVPEFSEAVPKVISPAKRAQTERRASKETKEIKETKTTSKSVKKPSRKVSTSDFGECMLVRL